MSASRIAATAPPPILDTDTAAPSRIRHLPAAALGRIASELRSATRYVFRYSVILLALLGLVSLWESRGDSQVPKMVPLMGTAKDPNRFSALGCAEQGVGDDQRWQGLAASLAILDDVNPKVAAWVRERHDCGRLVFSDRHTGQHDNYGSLAKYDHLGRRLTAQRGLLEENDGEIAAILCHEYRHSRQNAAKLVRCVLSFVLTADGDPSILENDAELYEHEARQAIFRR